LSGFATLTSILQMDYIISPLQLVLGFAACAIGALPFGLVNLNVMQTSLEQNSKSAMLVSQGASVVEVLYGVIAVFAGKILISTLESSIVFNLSIIIIIALIGIIFFFKQQTNNQQVRTHSTSFMRGIILNSISIQVLAYWIMAIAFLSTRALLDYRPVSIVLFLIGVWLGKMAVLVFYIYISKRIMLRSQVISRNINRVIGTILLLISAVRGFQYLYLDSEILHL